MYADTALGRVEASPDLEGTCPACGQPCRPKCGQVMVWHWAHHAHADCDPWAEPITEWHLGWQRAVPPERREVVIGPHRADIVTASGGVVEIQHSPVSPAVIVKREEFYGERMAWIFDATQADITVRPSGSSGKVQFRWKSPRWSAGACRKLMLLDLGGGWVLRVPRWASLTGGPGVLYTRASVEGWLQDGTRWERIIMPAS